MESGRVYERLKAERNLRHIVVGKYVKREVAERQPTFSSQTISPAGPGAPSSSCRDSKLTQT